MDKDSGVKQQLKQQLREKLDSSAVQTIGFVGGSQGSEEINNYVEQFLNSELETNFNVLHIYLGRS